MPSSTNPTRALIAALLGAGFLLAGCNILGPVGWLVTDERTPAAYKLDPKRSAVIFIDDRASVLPSRTLRDRIAKAAEQELLANKVLEVDLISSDSLQEVVVAERFSRPRSIAEIGRAVQAEQVIYATVDSFTLTPDGSQFAPVATLRVKVIDAVHDTRLFPESTGGGKDPSFTLTIPEKVRAANLPHSTSDVTKAQQELAETIGHKLGQLFYKHNERLQDPDRRIGS